MNTYQVPFHFIHVQPPATTVAGCDQLLARSRCALRRGRIDIAESLLMEGGDAIWANAEYLNVLGLIAEARGQWTKAKRLWGKSLRADKRYAPPRQNLVRYFELFQFGKSRHTVAFGDEPQFAVEEIRS